MTLKEFFRKARRWKWAVVGGDVRCANGYCPLGAVAQLEDYDFGGPDYTPEPEVAAGALGLRLNMASKIAGAADNDESPDRSWLLKNLGVTP